MSLHAPHLVLSGSFSTGKSTVYHALAEMFKDEVYPIPDGGEAIIKTFGKPIGEFTPQENHDAQMGVYQHYQDHLADGQQAYHMGRAQMVLSDASFLENLVYSRSFVTPQQLERTYLALAAIADHTHFVHFPVGETPLTDNNIRHVDRAYQLEVDGAIRALHREFGLRMTELTDVDLQIRIDQVAAIIRDMMSVRGRVAVLMS